MRFGATKAPEPEELEPISEQERQNAWESDVRAMRAQRARARHEATMRGDQLALVDWIEWLPKAAPPTYDPRLPGKTREGRWLRTVARDTKTGKPAAGIPLDPDAPTPLAEDRRTKGSIAAKTLKNAIRG